MVTCDLQRVQDWTRSDFQLTVRLKKILDDRDSYTTEDVEVQPRVARGWMLKMKTRDVSTGFLGFFHKSKQKWQRRYFVFDLNTKVVIERSTSL